MKIILKQGTDQLRFGMKQNDVIAIYGEPDKNYKDEEDNIIFMYNALKTRLTFYSEEDFRLGYLITSNTQAELLDKNVIGMDFTQLQQYFAPKGIAKFSKDEFDGYENYFNEDNWIILQTEFGQVTKLEIGAIINDNDEFDWVFKG